MQGFKHFLFFGFLILQACGPRFQQPDQNSSYFGRSVGEYQIEFQSFFLLNKTTSSIPNQKSISKNIETMYRFMLGQFKEIGSISNQYKYTLDSVEMAQDGRYLVSYTFTSKLVMGKDLKNITLYNLIETENLFEKSEGKCHQPDADISDSNFWYNWNPEKKGCPLQEGKHYYRTVLTPQPLVTTTKTYPEYSQLMKDEVLHVTLFVGYGDYQQTQRIPSLNQQNKVDYGAKAFLVYKDLLEKQLQMNSRVWSDEEVRKIYNPQKGSLLPYVEEFTKSYQGRMLKIKMIYAQTGLYQGSLGFHTFYQQALKNDSVIIYEGHSGIGKNVNLNLIEKNLGSSISLNPNYQIIHFGSCMPYAYYTESYFTKKKTDSDLYGTKKLDILSYAKEAHFGNVESHRLIKALDLYLARGLKTSYQDLITANPADYYGVTGDEDNL